MTKTNLDSIKGVFIIKRGFGNTVVFINKDISTEEAIDYFIVQNKLPLYFPINTVNKILYEINCMRKVLIDFDNKVAKSIVDKPIDFNTIINAYLTPESVENELNNPFEDEDIYNNKFQQL